MIRPHPLRPHRRHPLWLAFALHRASGLLLALFLPLHFGVLALALHDAARLDGFLAWTDYGIVKAAEFGLVFLLAIHMFGGLRLMAMEWLPPAKGWSGRQKSLAAGAVAASLFVSGTFLLQAL